MRRSHVSALLFAAMLASVGCAPDDADVRVLILHNQAPDDECELTPSETDYISFGLIDADGGTGYLMTPLLKNFSTVPENVDQTQRIFFMEGADITIDIGNDATGEPVFTQEEEDALAEEGELAFSTRLSGVVTPEEGLTTVAFEILPSSVIDAVAAQTDRDVQVIASVQVFGTMAGGDVATQVFAYPITICTGCLEVNIGACSALPEGFVGGGGCIANQDDAVACCTDSAGEEVCPAISETIPDPKPL
jgi:hypothetical protein